MILSLNVVAHTFRKVADALDLTALQNDIAVVIAGKLEEQGRFTKLWLHNQMWHVGATSTLVPWIDRLLIIDIIALSDNKQQHLSNQASFEECEWELARVQNVQFREQLKDRITAYMHTITQQIRWNLLMLQTLHGCTLKLSNFRAHRYYLALIL